MESRVEWPTIGLLFLSYLAWAAAVFGLATVAVLPAILVAGVAMTLHSSLQHEAIHGHPFRNETANMLVAWPPLMLFVPYLRFRDTHLDHHFNCELTDPFDDPESAFLDRSDWERTSPVLRRVLLFNNTLAGRLLIGPIIGTAHFLVSDWRNRACRRVQAGWLWHIPASLAVVTVVLASPMPFWAYLVACYISLSLLRIRTFLEHRPHDVQGGRSVVVEDHGFLALLFLNNNLHVVHHAHPAVPWYKLPTLFRENRERFLVANDGYLFRSYGEVFRRYFLARKDPVAHPLWRRRSHDDAGTTSG